MQGYLMGSKCIKNERPGTLSVLGRYELVHQRYAPVAIESIAPPKAPAL